MSLSPYGKAEPLAPGATRLTGGLLMERAQTDASALIPHVLAIFDDENSFFHEVENLRIAAGLKDGEFRGNSFGDGDFYKLLEGMFYAGTANADAAMLAKAEEYAKLVALAQQEDGYLSSKQIIAERQGYGVRHSDADDFEEYNFGHLFTCACAQKRLTGSDTLLAVARKAADYLLARYERLYAQHTASTAVCPSHYMGLVELYRLTGDAAYLRAARLAIALRDFVQNGTDDNQDRVPLREQREIVGHAVRSTYLYAGVADLYLETGDESLLPVLNDCYADLTEKKLYINGGCGALYCGASPAGDLAVGQRVHQAFGYAYQLPSITAYNETCASLGMIFWSQRMFMLDPSPLYFDQIERATYNLALAAVSLDGRKYFYENMLSRTWTLDGKWMWPLFRADNFECFCCPTNLARFLAQTADYAYMKDESRVYCGLYMQSVTDIALENGARFTLTQTTDWPWSGDVTFRVSGANGVPFELLARVPAWSREADAGCWRTLRFSGVNEEIGVSFDIAPRLMVANPKAEEIGERACVMRGPLVYCVENHDRNFTLDDLLLPSDATFTDEWTELDGRRVLALRTTALLRRWQNRDADALYQPLPSCTLERYPLRLLPYFAWDNEGFGEMRCWLPLHYQ